MAATETETFNTIIPKKEDILLWMSDSDIPNMQLATCLCHSVLQRWKLVCNIFVNMNVDSTCIDVSCYLHICIRDVATIALKLDKYQS